MAVLALVAGSPGRAQDAGPAPSRPFDLPPPLDLGTPPKPQISPREADRKTQDDRRPTYHGAMETALLNALVKRGGIHVAPLNAELKLWIDSSGRVTRVELVQPTGDAELDATLRNEILGLSLPAAPRDIPFKVRIKADRKMALPEKTQ